MRSITLAKAAFLAVLGGIVLAGSPKLVAAQDYVVNTFDTEDEVYSWTHWWGSTEWYADFDPAVDADGQASSGSMKITALFDGAAYGGDNQFSFRYDLPEPIDGTKYTNLVMDVRFDPGSAQRPAPDFGYLEYGVSFADYSQDYFGHTNIPITNGWIHLVAPVPPADANIDAITGVTFKMWMGDSVTGNTVFWVDNVKFEGLDSTEPLPPPRLSIGTPLPGLKLTASKAGSQYQRQSIRTMDNYNNSWVGGAQPVTYSMTIADFPDAAHSGFQAHIFLVPGDGISNSETSPDWNEPNVVFLQISNNADGTATGSLHYKVNEPNGNSMLWSDGSLGGISASKAEGTWSLVVQGSSFTIKTPDQTSTNLFMPEADVAMFYDPLYAYFGVQPNQLTNIGQSATLSNVQINGISIPINDSFTGSELDPNVWEVSAEDAPGITPIPSDAAYSISWTLPATGYQLQSSSSVLPGTWQDAGITGGVTASGKRSVIVPSSALPSAKQGFFRLIQP